MNIRKMQWGVGGAGKANIHTYTHSVHRDTQGGWSLGKDRTQS